MGVTLEKVARRANVAKSAVSVVLRGHPIANRYKQETRQRIFDAAKELGYQANFFASQLRSEKKSVLMLCLSYLQDPYSSMVAEGFVCRARELGYQIIINLFKDKEDPHSIENEILGKHGVHAMVVIGSSKDKLTDEAIENLADDGVTIVLVGRRTGLSKVSEILVDEYAGAYQAAKYIYEQKAVDVWTITYRHDVKAKDIWIRTRAVKDYAEQHGLPLPYLLEVETAYSPSGLAAASHAAVSKKLKELPPPHAIIANGDYFAYGAMAALNEAGLCVGKDVAVTGFDDAWQSEFTSPPLTTVRQPMIEMGTVAADVLIDSIEGKITVGRKVTLMPELIIRKSGCLQTAPKLTHE